ncbi:hypothetical protein Tco_0209939 [Tanacetum coccineum]
MELQDKSGAADANEPPGSLSQPAGWGFVPMYFGISCLSSVVDIVIVGFVEIVEVARESEGNQIVERCVWLDLVGSWHMASWAPGFYRSWVGGGEAACYGYGKCGPMSSWEGFVVLTESLPSCDLSPFLFHIFPLKNVYNDSVLSPSSGVLRVEDVRGVESDLWILQGRDS